MKQYISIDIGGSAIKSALINAEGKLSLAEKIPTPKSLTELVEVIKKIQNNYAQLETQGIAISMPGLIDSATGYAIHGGALDYISELNVRELLQTACGVPVQIENDGKCAALGEHWLGNLVGVENGIALVIGTGIAGGIIIHNQLVRGHHLTAGEFSYIRTISGSNEWKDIFAIEGSAILLSNAYASIRGIDKTKMTGKQFFADVVAEVPEAVNLLSDYSQKIAQQLMNLQTILDPEIITIGGGISKQAVLFEQLNQHLDDMVTQFPLPLVRPTIKQSALGNNANLLGALKNFINQETK